MPLYSYRCLACEAETDEFNRISERESGAPACGCGAGQMQAFITPVRGFMREDCHYECPATGQQVTSQRQRKNLFAEHGLVDARELDQKKMREDQRKRRAAREELVKKFDPGVDLTPYLPQPAI